MANIKSAVKRIRVSERNRLRNKSYKSAVKTLIKRSLAAIEEYAQNPNAEKEQAVRENMKVAYSKIDKAVKRGVLHANNGARKKSRLAKAMHKAESQAS
ncbi:30S ribosomal protein S20 [Geitlerinema sp. PCC 9228]|uniref:30S ribosomal protein S20 n=1 Tax=Geitlerinema sp. PCC 9228 TaxID=111611 RepID=UPI0008F9C4D4|nr:30S ribosomal protein S20 [Geitlerinema sp. PCC 9228]